MHLIIDEDFRDLITSPYLFAFKYSLESLGSPLPATLFRYECHPESDDPRGVSEIEDEVFQNPYSIVPHFHPDVIDHEHLRKLHYPFQRSERQSILFALISWLEIDMCHRFGV